MTKTLKTLGLTTGEVKEESLDMTVPQEEDINGSHQLTEYAGVVMPLSRFQEAISDAVSSIGLSNISAWGLYDKLQDIWLAEMHGDMNVMQLAAFKLAIAEDLRQVHLESSMDEEETLNNLIHRFCRVCDWAIEYLNPKPGFYLDTMASENSVRAWPVVSVNSEGFHNCIGLIQEKDSGKYIAIPFIKEIPHVSQEKMINDIMEKTWDERIKSLPKSGDQNMNYPYGMSYPYSMIIGISFAKYLYGTPLAHILQNLNAGNYCESQVIANKCIDGLYKSMYITEDLVNGGLTYAEMFKELSKSTLELDASNTDDSLIIALEDVQLEIKTYNDLSLAMTDIINITQVGMKASQQKEISNFFSDFLK